MGLLLTFLGFIGFVVGLIGLIKPFSFMKTRKNAAIFMVAAFAVMTVGLENNSAEVEKEQQAQQEQTVDTAVSTDKAKTEANKAKEQEPEEESTQEETYLRLNGRGKSDQGRNEPMYEGLIGFVAAQDADSTKKPWKVNTVKQIGPEKFEETKQTVPHKTKVKVLEQHLNHDGWGFYEGFLIVESVKDEKQFKIDVNNFVTYPYWEDSVEEAVKMGPVIAEYTGDGDKPVDRFGKLVSLEPGTKVVVVGTAGTNGYIPDGFVEGKKGDSDIYLDPESLKIVY